MTLKQKLIWDAFIKLSNEKTSLINPLVKLIINDEGLLLKIFETEENLENSAIKYYPLIEHIIETQKAQIINLFESKWFEYIRSNNSEMQYNHLNYYLYLSQINNLNLSESSELKEFVINYFVSNPTHIKSNIFTADNNLFNNISERLKIKIQDDLKNSNINISQIMERISNDFSPANAWYYSVLYNELKNNIDENELNRLKEAFRENTIALMKKNFIEEENKISVEELEKNILRMIEITEKGNLSPHDFANYFYDIEYFHPSFIVSYNRKRDNSLSSLDVNMIKNINTKDINQIINLFKEMYYKSQEDIDSDYNDIKLDWFEQKTLVNMYLTVGMQNTMDLIAGEYGTINYSQLENMFDEIDITNVSIPTLNATPQFDEKRRKLLSFLFANGKNDNTANIKKIISEEIKPEDIPFSRLINEWDIIYDSLGGVISVENIKKQMNNLVPKLAPDREHLKPVLKFAGLSKEVMKKVFELDDKMKKRTHSSIPKIKGNSKNFEYEILDLTDPNQMNVGYITNCCFTINGASESALEHSVTNKDGRIFVLKKDGEILAQSWVWRNGSTICFDNVEIVGTSRKYLDDFQECYQKAARQFIDATSLESKPVNLVTVGDKYSKVKLKGDKLNTPKLPLPAQKRIYSDAIDNQTILATAKDFTIDKIQEYDAEAVYEDPRKPIKVIKPELDEEKNKSINELVNNIDYTNTENKVEYKNVDVLNKYNLIACNNDWYIGIGKDGQIDVNGLDYDQRAKEEMSKYSKVLKELLQQNRLNISNTDIINYINAQTQEETTIKR